MVKTEAKFRDGLIQLINTTPLNEVNVALLCEFTKSNRQTFYYHYRDISDVVENIFLKEKVGVGKTLNNFDAITKVLINYINNNYKFLSEVSKSYASDKLNEFFFSFYYKHLQSINKKSKKLDSHNLTTIRYISTVGAKELMFWISTKRREKSTDLIKRLDVLWEYLSTKYSMDIRKAALKEQ